MFKYTNIPKTLTEHVIMSKYVNILTKHHIYSCFIKICVKYICSGKNYQNTLKCLMEVKYF